MSTNRQHINVVLVYIYRHFADTLRGIGVEEDLSLTADFSNLLDRLDDSNLVVHVNNGAKQGVLTYGALQLV